MHCPKCGPTRYGYVCGGDYPYWRHNKRRTDCPNIYFEIELETKKPTGEVEAEEWLLPWLNEDDMEEMVDHAYDNGCMDDPQCSICREFLVQTIDIFLGEKPIAQVVIPFDHADPAELVAVWASDHGYSDDDLDWEYA